MAIDKDILKMAAHWNFPCFPEKYDTYSYRNLLLVDVSGFLLVGRRRRGSGGLWLVGGLPHLAHGGAHHPCVYFCCFVQWAVSFPRGYMCDTNVYILNTIVSG